MIKTGGAKEVITPSYPFAMAGYAPIREATGVHDELYVRVCPNSRSNRGA